MVARTRSMNARLARASARAAKSPRSSFGAVAGWLLSAGLLLSLAGPDHAQAQTTYVDNTLSATTSSRSLLSTTRAQTFTTGGTASDSYALGSVGFRFHDIFSNTVLDVSMWSTTGSDDDPDAELFDLTVPTLSNGNDVVVSFTAPEGTMLTGGTTYAVVISQSSGGSNNRLVRASGGTENAAESGWSIGDSYHTRSGSSWNTTSGPFQITVKGPAGSANTDATGQPAITGTPQVGQMLTAAKGNIADAEGTTKADNGDTGYAYTYQWFRVDDDGMSNKAEISGATSATYTLTTAEVGKKIVVEVSFTDDADNDEGPLASDATANAVVAKQENCDTTDRPGNDWCAEITVLSAVVGGSTFTEGLPSDATIDYGDDSYTVSQILLQDLGGVRTVHFVLDAFAPRGTVFNFGGTEFIANASSETTTTGDYRWSAPTGFDWIDGQKVTVSANFPPGLDTATVDGDQLVLTYFEDLDAGSEPAPGQFSVTVDGGTPAAPSSVDVSGKTVTLTLAAAVTSGQTVTLTYTVPTTDPLQDESGLAAAALTDQVVTNNTDASTDATLSGLELTWDDAGTATDITLDPTFDTATTAYTAEVGNSVDEITVVPTENDAGATVAYFDGDDMSLTDADSVADDFQVDLSVGENTVKVKVTAEDGNTTETYAVVVTRAEIITVGYDPVDYDVSEDGGSVTLTVKISSHPVDGAPRAFILSASTADGTAMGSGGPSNDYGGCDQCADPIRRRRCLPNALRCHRERHGSRGRRDLHVDAHAVQRQRRGDFRADGDGHDRGPRRHRPTRGRRHGAGGRDPDGGDRRHRRRRQPAGELPG